MGFYFRKSKSFGPFRLNFSKSGIGLSTGVKGARLSFGPKGTYVNLGSNGVYYRKKIGSKSNNKNNYLHEISKPEDNITSAVNISNESMVESEFEQELITNIKKARRINTLWIFSLLLMYVLMCVYPLLFLVFIALLVFRILFRKYFRAEINYELDEIANNKWKDFISSVNLLRNSKKYGWLKVKIIFMTLNIMQAPDK